MTSFRSKTAAEFCASYRPLAYILEGIIHTSAIYSLTARTGSGKTAFGIALVLAVATGRRDILGIEVEPGRVAYLAFENPEDVKMKLAVAAHRFHIDLGLIGDRVVIIDERLRPEDVFFDLKRRSCDRGFVLIFLDTLAAGFDGCDVSDNVQAGEYVRRLRPLTTLPGLPAVVIAAHPTKSASDDNLVPYGAGAILNEVDGNLTISSECRGEAQLSWKGKFRGPNFAPVDFSIIKDANAPMIVDSKGRLVPLPVMQSATIEKKVVGSSEPASDEDRRRASLLKAMIAEPRASQRRWAILAGLNETAVSRGLAALRKAGRVTQDVDGRWVALHDSVSLFHEMKQAEVDETPFH